MAESQNGITLMGKRDKFLSIKWDEVSGACSYAVFKELVINNSTDSRETLGALRPGNSYILRVIALDSSNNRLKVLGPATFFTEGPEDKRQPKVNQQKLEENWTEVLGQYPEPAAKADPYSGATPCPYSWQCTLMDNLAHCGEYGHPRPLVCPNGASCILATSSKDHAKQFSH